MKLKYLFYSWLNPRGLVSCELALIGYLCRIFIEVVKLIHFPGELSENRVDCG